MKVNDYINKKVIQKPNYEREDFILIYIGEETVFRIKTNILMKYLIGTPLLLLNSQDQTMYMSELDNVLDFVKEDDIYSYVQFKPEKYNFAYDKFWLQLMKRFHWSWLFYSRRYFMEEFRTLNQLLNVEARKHHTVIPSKDLIYSAFTNFNMFDTKVCIIGQDPYPNEKDATGIAFQVNHGNLTSSLKHINKAVQEINMVGIQPDLNNWIEQGVLLLNSALTYTKDVKSFGLWKPFIIHIIKCLDSLKHPVVYVLVGKQANELRQFISLKQTVLEVEHPAAASYNKREWEHNDAFRRLQNITDIKW